MTTKWTNERLSRLFDRYNTLYWKGRLKRWKAVNEALDGSPLGLCDGRRRRLTVDCSKHSSDKAVRSTLLHEMCHVATPGERIAHGSRFWSQLEMLLRKGALIQVGYAEAPGLRVAPPPRFRRARRAFLKAHDRRVGAALRQLKQAGRLEEEQVITIEDIAKAFEDAALLHGANWRHALLGVLGQYTGMLDVDLKPSSSMQRYLPLFRKHHQRGLRDRREYKTAQERFKSGKVAIKKECWSQFFRPA